MTAELQAKARDAERAGRWAEARESWQEAADGAHNASARITAQTRLARLLLAHEPFNGEAEAESLLTQAREEALRLKGDEQYQSMATSMALLARLERSRGRLDAARAWLEKSPAAHLLAPPGPIKAQWHLERGRLEADRGSFGLAERQVAKAFGLYRTASPPDEEGFVEASLGLAGLLLRRGLPGEALAFAQRGLERARSLGDRPALLEGLALVGRAQALRGRERAAADALVEGLELARDLGDIAAGSELLTDLGTLALESRRLDDAARAFAQALESSAGAAREARALIGLARARLAQNDLDAAALVADRAQFVLDHGRRDPETDALHDVLQGLRGAIDWRAGDLPRGERQIVTAVDALRRRGLAAECLPLLVGLRDLYRERGELTQALAAMAAVLDAMLVRGDARAGRETEDWLRTLDDPNRAAQALRWRAAEWLADPVETSGSAPRRLPVAIVHFELARGSGFLSGATDSEAAAIESLDAWLVEATRVIRLEGGILADWSDDTLIAAFGIPTPQTDDAARAVRAAIGLREALQLWNVRREACGERTMHAAMGVDHGTAILAEVGPAWPRPLNLLGPVLETAGRLAAAAATAEASGAEVLISGSVETAQRASRAAETRFLANLEPGKGQHGRIAAYRVVGG